MFANKFSHDVYLQKYSMNQAETWPDTCKRVVDNVCGDLLPTDVKIRIQQYMTDRKFIPGGRYLYAAGRPFHQVNNCLAGEERIITRKGVFRLDELVGQSIEVANRYGEWEPATVHSFGQQSLVRVIMDDGREMFATPDHRWWQMDGTRITTKNLREIPVAPAIPTETDNEGIRHGIIFGDGQVATKGGYSYVILVGKKQELAGFFDPSSVARKGRYGEDRWYQPIREIKAGTKVSLQPLRYKELPIEPTREYARGFIAGLIATDGSTKTSSVTISCEGWDRANHIAELAVYGGCRVRSVRVASLISPFTGEARELCVVTLENDTAPIVASYQEKRSQYSTKPRKVQGIEYCGRHEEVFCVVAPKSESFTLANGLITSNCFLFRADDSREGWADAMHKSTMALMTGGGIGFDYSAVRPEGSKIEKTGGTATGPIALMNMVNESGRYIMQGGQRRSAIWAGLNWCHLDIEKFMTSKNHSPELMALKAKDFTFPLPMELTNISVIYGTDFFDAMDAAARGEDTLLTRLAKIVWLKNCRQAFETAEPGMSFNYKKDRESLRNACTEVTSEDDSDKCNLGTVWMNRCKTAGEFADVCSVSTAFLLCGSIYSDLPTERIREVGNKNNRIGLGLGGMHEWLMERGSEYVVTDEMHTWLNIYESASDRAADVWSDNLGVNLPKGIRALAPTGTIGILAETTTGIEPLFCKAYRRRYFKDGQWHAQYVVDGTVKSLLAKGVPVEQIQDAYDLSFEQRVKFQFDVQSYVDMSISSTCNMTPWGSPDNNEKTVEKYSDILLKYAEGLRGFTCYPDGARSGQPLERVTIEEALANEGKVIIESSDICSIGKGGTCGS